MADPEDDLLKVEEAEPDPAAELLRHESIDAGEMSGGGGGGSSGGDGGSSGGDGGSSGGDGAGDGGFEGEGPGEQSGSGDTGDAGSGEESGAGEDTAPPDEGGSDETPSTEEPDAEETQPGPSTEATTEPPVVVIHTQPTTNPAEQALESRLAAGDGTPEEALAWFQEHGFPELSGLPHFDAEQGLWMFPDTAGTGAGPTGLGIQAGGDSGSSASSAGGDVASTGSGRGQPAHSEGSAGDSGSSGAPGGGGGFGAPGGGGDSSSGGAGSSGGDAGSSEGGQPGSSGGGGEIGFPGQPTGGGSGSGTFTPAPAAGASPPPPPVPGSLEADRQAGLQIGRMYGEFRAGSEFFLKMLHEPHGGVSVWDRMSQQERLQAIQKVQSGFENLPTLPRGSDAAHDAAIRQGFEEGARRGYEADRFATRAVWVAGELAKAVVMGAAAAPTVVGVGAVEQAAMGDCAARTASLLIQRATGVEVSAADLVGTYGLPTVSTSSYSGAVKLARDWFTKIGIGLEDNPGGFAPVAQGGVAGDYVIFMQGGSSGGHVVFGTVSQEGIIVIDNQVGRTFTSLVSAQNGLGMRATAAYRVKSVNVP